MPQGSPYERKFGRILKEHEFTVFRSAGSRAVDIIAIREVGGIQMTYLFEVKSFKKKRFYPSMNKKTNEQWVEMKRLEKRFWKDGQGTVHVRYVLHKKNGGWAISLPSNLNLPSLHSDLTKWLRGIQGLEWA